MGRTTTWIAEAVSRLRKAEPVQAEKALERQPPGTLPSGAPPRSLSDRLDATLRRSEEGLSPRELRRLRDALEAVAAPELSEVEGGRYAKTVADWYVQASAQARQDLWLLLCEHFAPDLSQLEAARARYVGAIGTAQAASAEVQLRRALASPRARVLQRFAVFPEGMRFLVDLRAALLGALKSNPRLLVLDAELEQLFATWFDVAFLELRRISWDSPASLLEKLIQYEAVHDIRSWADLKNRLDSDRRCYGFFHPRLPNEPLIFVEVALQDHLVSSIAPLLDESAEPADLTRATTAIFYSISNTQSGLRGVSFGDSLIKNVVETLAAEVPRLRTFATLSPIPGFRGWLTKHAEPMLALLDPKRRAQWERTLGGEALTPASAMAAIDKPLLLDAQAPAAQWVTACAAHYLAVSLSEGRPADPVARFHLGNGARIERLNWAGDPSAKGVKQSYGLMVNYLYDLKRLDKHRTLLAQGRVAVSSEVEALCKTLASR